MVCGFGAAGNEGKASSPPRVAARDAVAAEAEATQDGRDEDADALVVAVFFLAGGRVGNDAAGGGRTAGATVHPGGTLDDTGAGPASRVLFLSLRTRLECFWDGAPLGMAGLAEAADDQPLEEDVAPCMPDRPGREG